MSVTREELLKQVAESPATSGNKVTVVGIGQVGMACAFSILTQVRKIYITMLLFAKIFIIFSRMSQVNLP